MWKSALPKLSQHCAVLLFLLRRRRRRWQRGWCHRSERDAVEVGDEGLPAAAEGSVQGLSGTKGMKVSIRHTWSKTAVRTNHLFTFIHFQKLELPQQGSSSFACWAVVCLLTTRLFSFHKQFTGNIQIDGLVVSVGGVKWNSFFQGTSQAMKDGIKSICWERNVLVAD